MSGDTFEDALAREAAILAATRQVWAACASVGLRRPDEYTPVPCSDDPEDHTVEETVFVWNLGVLEANLYLPGPDGPPDRSPSWMLRTPAGTPLGGVLLGRGPSRRDDRSLEGVLRALRTRIHEIAEPLNVFLGSQTASAALGGPIRSIAAPE